MIRSRARRRSVSIWDSPGPLVPIPPSMRPAPRRSRWVHSPLMRARLYSSCASSTWSLPSAVWAWSAKMSRITAVRSITGTPSACSRLRSWRGTSSSSTATRLASAAAISRFSSVELAPAQVAVGIGRGSRLGHLPGRRHPGRAQQLLQLGQGIVAVLVVADDSDCDGALAGARVDDAGGAVLHGGSRTAARCGFSALIRC